MTNLLKKGAFATDIHFGKKANSKQHNDDCLNFLDWFCDQVKSDPDIDYVAFLGDWNENRSALNIATLNASYTGAKKLNDLGLPVYFIIGNHDLYHRHTREIHSVIPFTEFSNFVLIEEPTIVDDIEGGVLFVPYMFHEEYPGLTKYLNVPFWAGHFEFKGFEVTGYGMKMPTGPQHTDFTGPKYIASGHFHKRQVQDNIVYIGNAFPMDFGDAGDTDRGMMTYDHRTNDMMFENWAECPKYTKIKLSDLLNKKVTLHEGARVNCVADIPISFEERNYINKKFADDYKLREFTLEESHEIKQTLSGKEDDDMEIDWENEDGELIGVDELVHQMLQGIESKHISNEILSKIYIELKPDND